MFGRLVAQHRRRLVLTQEELASRTGLSVRTLRMLESGSGRIPRPSSVRLLADAFGLAGAEREKFVGLALQPAVEGAPAELPADVPAFVGRAGELDQLDQTLSGAGPIVVSAVAGTAGIGKTALVVHWAHRAGHHFPDGQMFIDLRGYDPGEPVSPGDALARLLGSLGVPREAVPRDVEERAARFRTLTTGRRMLLVLDNAASAEQVRPLLPGSGSCLVVVTSRDALAGLVAVNGARRLDLDLLPRPDALRLLRGLAGERVDAEPEMAATLAELCGRLPLAIRIAAQLAASRPRLPLADLVEELGDERRRLAVLDTGDDPRAAVSTVFSWSIRHLAPPARHLFALLGLHPGPEFGPAAAAALAGTDVPAGRRALAAVARAHLVQENGPGRYRMHDLLRAYAVERAVAELPAPDRRAALDRLFDYYLAAAAAAMDTVYPAEAKGRLSVPPSPVPLGDLAEREVAARWLDTELPVFAAVAAYTATHGWPGHTVRLSQTLGRYLVGGRHVDAGVVHSLALEAARRLGDPAAEAENLRGLGIASVRQGRYAAAMDQIEQARLLYQRAGDAAGAARALANLGAVEHRRSRFASAAGHLRRALAEYERLDDGPGIMRCLINLGSAELRVGRAHEARAHLERALDAALAADDPDQEAATRNNLGDVAMQLGQVEAAREQYERALARFRELGDHNGVAWSLDCLGSVHTRLGDPSAAEAYHRQALDLFQQVKDRDGEQWSWNGLGEAALADGRPDDALAHHAAALAAAKDTGDPKQQARAYAGLGAAHDALGHPGEARQHRERALTLYAHLGVPEAGALRAQLGQ
ncbi:tetratricopeptide repeat protein [Actinoplanes sp. NPDC089786]|uniref:ATP-binding protein n=1 Tax=Actinoplanes sp. NPDC089786 TaxID=3155185 RepID=UPI003428438E